MDRIRSRSRHTYSAEFSGTRGRVSMKWPVFAIALLCGASLLWMGPAPAEAVPEDLQSVPLSGSVQVEVDSLTAQAQAAQAEIDALDQTLEQTTESYNQLREQLEDLNIDMIKLRRQIKAAQDDHDYRVDKYEDRLCDLYKSGGSNQFLELILTADGGEDLMARVRVAAQLADQDKQIVENLEASTEKLDGLLAQLDETKAEQLQIREQVDQQEQQISAALAERERALAGLDAEITAIIEQERLRQEEEQRRLQEALAAILNGGQVYSGQLPQTDNEIINQFLETAATYIGIPYVWGGDRPSTGMDCSGFTQFVYAQHGVSLPHYSGYQAEMGTPVDYFSIQPGDLLAFGFPVHHVGIYIGEDLFIHAPGTGDYIKISVLSEHGDLAAIRRFDLQPRAGAPAIY
jgi:peptidoglycan DL-endopeptidase CwlO